MERLKNILLLLVASGFAIATHATPDTTIVLTLQKTIPGSFADFYTDGLNNTYLLTLSNQIKKLDGSYDSAAVYNDVRRYGDISWFDGTNPLKELVYYKDFTTILVLDRFLNPRNTIDLRNAGILQAKAIAASYDNNYWVFDELDNKLKKLDDNGNLLLQSADFRVLFGEGYNPTRIIDNGGLLYLYDEKNGWLIFDYYGGLKQKLPITGWKNVQVENKSLMGHDENYLYITNPTAISLQKIKPNFNVAAALKVQKRGNNFFVLTKEGLTIYSL